MLVTAYTFYERVRQTIARHRGEILDEEFAGDVTLTARFPADRFPDVQADLQQLSSGQVEAAVIRTEEAIVPLGAFDGSEGTGNP
jgi:putative IMPACT (imprinted ancient) family translation regulator